MLIHVAITIDHLCGSRDVFKSCPLDGGAPLQCGETTYSGASMSTLATICPCSLLSICGIEAQSCIVCAAGVMVMPISSCWQVYVNGEPLRPFFDKSLLSTAFAACGAVVWNCDCEEVFITETF
jgi:hypothetical protein